MINTNIALLKDFDYKKNVTKNDNVYDKGTSKYYYQTGGKRHKIGVIPKHKRNFIWNFKLIEGGWAVKKIKTPESIYKSKNGYAANLANKKRKNQKFMVKEEYVEE